MAGVVQLGSIIGLMAIGLKRNNDCYKAEMELLDEQMKNFGLEYEIIKKDAEIRQLKQKCGESMEEA